MTRLEILQYIKDNIKPFGYVKIPFRYIAADGYCLSLPKDDPEKSLERAEKSIEQQRKYVSKLKILNETIEKKGETIQLNAELLKYLFNYIDESPNYGANMIFTSQYISLENSSDLRKRATDIDKKQEGIKAIKDLIKEFEDAEKPNERLYTYQEIVNKPGFYKNTRWNKDEDKGHFVISAEKQINVISGTGKVWNATHTLEKDVFTFVKDLNKY